jgi:hypothetical protein
MARGSREAGAQAAQTPWRIDVIGAYARPTPRIIETIAS